MTAKILDGKAVAAELRAKVAEEAAKIAPGLGRKPGLAVVLVGADPASEVYVRNKARSTVEAGRESFEHKLPATTTEAELLALVQKLNGDDTVDGILVQLPLPKHIDSARVLNALDPAKDVDGFHPLNAGRLATGLPVIVAGDFNSAPTGSAHRVFGRSSGLGTWRTLLGRGTWPAWAPPALGLPIDRVWASGEVRLRAARVGPRFRSDHRPIVVDLLISK